MPFIVKSKSSQIADSLKGGLMGLMQAMQLKAQMESQRERLILAKAANTRAETQSLREGARHEQWLTDAPVREAARADTLLRASEYKEGAPVREAEREGKLIAAGEYKEGAGARETAREAGQLRDEEFMDPANVALRQEAQRLRMDLARLQKESAEYAKLTRPSQAEVAAERKRKVEMDGKRATLVDLDVTRGQTAAKHEILQEAQWPKNKQLALESLATQIGPLDPTLVSQIGALPWMGAGESEKALAIQLSTVVTKWGQPRVQDMLDEVAEWESDEDLSTMVPTATQVIGRTNPSDANSVRTAEASLSTMRRNVEIRSTALAWLNNPETHAKMELKRPITTPGVGGGPETDAVRSQRDAWSRWEYLWNDHKKMLLRMPTVQADGTVAYPHDYGEVARSMEAMLAFDPTDPAFTAFVTGLTKPPGSGAPGSGLAPGGAGFGADTLARERVERLASQQGALSPEVTKRLDNELTTSAQGDREGVMLKQRGLENALQEITGYQAADTAQTPEAVYEHILRLDPSAATLLQDANGEFSVERLFYFVERLSPAGKERRIGDTERPEGMDDLDYLGE